jgi:hypothetical protein
VKKYFGILSRILRITRLGNVKAMDTAGAQADEELS